MIIKATRRLPICCQGQQSCIVCVVAERHCQHDTRRSSGAHFLQPIIDRYPFHSSFENLISRLQGVRSLMWVIMFPSIYQRHVRKWVKYQCPGSVIIGVPSILKLIISQEITTAFRCKTEIYTMLFVGFTVLLFILFLKSLVFWVKGKYNILQCRFLKLDLRTYKFFYKV